MSDLAFRRGLGGLGHSVPDRQWSARAACQTCRHWPLTKNLPKERGSVGSKKECGGTGPAGKEGMVRRNRGRGKESRGPASASAVQIHRPRRPKSEISFQNPEPQTLNSLQHPPSEVEKFPPSVCLGTDL